jgi:uncharacterized protein
VRPHPEIDGLRALALAGVVLVNVTGYSMFPDTWHVVPPPVPSDSVAALVTQWSLLAFLQAKAYPLLSILFGMGLVWSLRDRGAEGRTHRRRRMWRLLLIGAVHGALIYAGDVLTAYALMGFVLLAWSRLRLRQLIVRWWWMFGLSIVLTLLQLGLVVALVNDPGLAPPVGQSHGSVTSLWQHVALTAPSYLGAQVFVTVVMAPQLLWLMLTGVILARVGALSRARWRPAWQRYLQWALPLGLIANLALATVSVRGWPGNPELPHPLSVLTLLFGPLLASAVLAAVVVHKPRWIVALAPAGRWTLTIYLASSLLWLVLLGGAGFGLGPPLGSVATFALGLSVYLALLAGVQALGRRGLTGPLERWLATR